VIFCHYEALTSPSASPKAKALAASLQEGAFIAFLARAQELGCKDVRHLIDLRATEISDLRRPTLPPAASPNPAGPNFADQRAFTAERLSDRSLRHVPPD